MKLDHSPIAGVVARDLVAAKRSPGVVIPMIVVPLVFTILLPLVTWIISRTDGAQLPLDSFADLIPGDLYGRTSNGSVRMALMLATYIFPTLLVVVPLMVVSVICTDSIAGERERGTLEGVLLSPISDRQLLLGKVLSAAVPAAVVHLVCSLMYCVAINVVFSGAVDGLVLPSSAWAFIALWVGPAFAAVMLGVAVLISARASSVQGASQVTGVAVFPLIAMVVGQMGGVTLLSDWIVLIVGAGLWVTAFALVRFGARSMTRSRLARDLR